MAQSVAVATVHFFGRIVSGDFEDADHQRYLFLQRDLAKISEAIS